MSDPVPANFKFQYLQNIHTLPQISQTFNARSGPQIFIGALMQCLCPNLSTFCWIWFHVWPYDAFFLNHLMNGLNYVILSSVGKTISHRAPCLLWNWNDGRGNVVIGPGFYFFGTFAFHQATKEIYGFHLAEGYLDNLSYWC